MRKNQKKIESEKIIRKVYYKCLMFPRTKKKSLFCDFLKRIWGERKRVYLRWSERKFRIKF